MENHIKIKVYIKDSSRNEILVCNLCEILTIGIVTKTINKLVNNKYIKLYNDSFINSDLMLSLHKSNISEAS